MQTDVLFNGGECRATAQAVVAVGIRCELAVSVRLNWSRVCACHGACLWKTNGLTRTKVLANECMCMVLGTATATSLPQASKQA